jgi:hypothetical protein
MAYTPQRPPIAESPEQLRERIPGWGVDLDPNNRPSATRLQWQEDTGAHWEFPERQPEKWPRERSVQHEFLTPVFGTACPPRGLSGAVRRLSYRRYSEAQAAHWLLLVMADRVDAWENHLRSFVSLRPDNPITETGVLSEFTHHGLRSRLGQNRADLRHHPLDPVIVAGPWVAGVYVGVRAVRRALHVRGMTLTRRRAAPGRRPPPRRGRRG